MKLKLNKKITIKYIFKTMLSGLIIVFMALAPTTIFNKLLISQAQVNKEIEIKYMGILELWNIDTFEGGSKSRTSFLERQALQFEKDYTGTFIMVYSMTKEQAVLNLKNGQKPDLVSFGIGVGDELIQSLIPLKSTYSVRDDLINGGRLNDIQYALPYMMGGYVLISENECQQNGEISQSIGFGGNADNCTLLSLGLNNISAKNVFDRSNDIDSFTAYDKYLDKNFDCLVGTQRDLYRVQNRIDKGNMTSRNFHYLSGYTDLLQYIGICSTDYVKQEISQKFVEKLLSSKTQLSLVDYGMFSTTNQPVFSTGEMVKMQSALNQPLKTISVFMNSDSIKSLQNLCFNQVCKGEKLSKEINKFLV